MGDRSRSRGTTPRTLARLRHSLPSTERGLVQNLKSVIAGHQRAEMLDIPAVDPLDEANDARDGR
jgi:hypothetical protein